MKLRVAINADEWYPVHDIFESEHGQYELDRDVVERYRAARDAHQAAIDEVDALIDAQIRQEQGRKKRG